MENLKEYIKDQIWILEYPVRFAGMDIFGRTTIIRLENGDLIVHDPCKIDDSTKEEIDELGKVKYIIAPGSYHYLFVTDFQKKYPDAETFLCPGLERKRPEIKFDWILGNKPDHRWEDAIEQVLVQGTKIIWEVAFYHKPSKTLILVDLLENIGWKAILRMWNNPKPAPEYQMGWGNKAIVKIALEKILSWDARRVIIAHGVNIEEQVNETLAKAWKRILNA
jgi:hypothetical protein